MEQEAAIKQIEGARARLEALQRRFAGAPSDVARAIAAGAEALQAAAEALRHSASAPGRGAGEPACLQSAATAPWHTTARYRALVDQLPALIYTAAPDTRNTTLYASPLFEALLGFALDEWLQNPDLFIRLLHDADRQRVMDAWDRTIASGEPFDCEYRLVARDGRTIWLHDRGMIVRDAAGQPRFIQGVAFDITERRRLEEALRASEERFQLIARVTNDVLYDWDMRADVVWWSEGVRAFFSCDSTTGTTTLDLWLHAIHPDDTDWVMSSLMAATARRDTFWSAEYRFRRADGVYTTIVDRGCILYDQQGQPHHMLGAMVDASRIEHATPVS